MNLGRVCQSRLLLLCAGAVLALTQPAQAARPLLDQHQWDRYFALFARDTDVPWRTTSVRLDTYSSAPVAFSAYAVQPEDVLVAGHARGRALDVTGRSPIATWRFTPPPGYRVEGSDVSVPLRDREGLFLIQARRGAAVQQVWINRSRIGLVSKEGPQGITIYGCDLGSGQPLAHLRIFFLVNRTLVERYTARDGLLHWDGNERPSFVLAEWGASRAFLSLLPQAPVPRNLTAVRVDRAVTRAGESFNVVGYARQIHGQVYQRASGAAEVKLLLAGRVVTSSTLPLDAAGAFVGTLSVPSGLTAGRATVLATVNGASAGTSITIEAAGDLRLWLHSTCMKACSGTRSVPLVVHAERHGQVVADEGLLVSVVRYPHIVAPNANFDASASWGATEVLHLRGRTDALGDFHATVPMPGDMLPSTLGVTARTDGGQASVTTRMSVPNSAVALTVAPEHPQVDVGHPIIVNVHGFHAASGAALSGFVHVRLSHGPNAAAQVVALDRNGQARAIFNHPQMGTDLLVASYHGVAGEAVDANSVLVAPRALTEQSSGGLSSTVATESARYRPPAKISLDASAPGADGAALLTLDGLSSLRQSVGPVQQGHAHGVLELDEAAGAVQASVAYVHAGALVLGASPLVLDGLGHERHLELSLPTHVLPAGSNALIDIHDGSVPAAATTIIRLTEGVPSDGAIFDTIGQVLAVGGVTTLVSASEDPPWHAWVTPSHSIAADFLADFGHRPVPEPPPALDASAARVVYWQVEHDAGQLRVPLPQAAGDYVLSIIRIYANGDVGGASTMLNVS